MTRFGLIVLGIVGTALVLGGCPGSTTSSLSETQQAAVTQVVKQVTATAAALGTCSALTDHRVDPNDIAVSGGFGECPQVSFSASTLQAQLLLSFGTDGCSGAATGGQTVQGAVEATVTRATRSAAITFTDLQYNSQAITGGLGVTLRAAPDEAIVLDGTCNISTARLGTVAGNITVAMTAAGVMTIRTGEVAVAGATASYQVTLTDVVVDPVTNGNFIPQSGSARFVVPSEGGPGPTQLTVVVTFTSQSPVNGTVQVQVQSLPAETYAIAGLP